MHFANPKYLYLLIFIPIYLVYFFYYKKKARGIVVPVLDDLKMAARTKRFRYSQEVKIILLAFIITLWSLVLARPQGEHKKQEIGKKGIDIIVAMDVSGTMRAEDLHPNRIEAAKKSLRKFINGLGDDRLGIIVFAGQAFTQSPLTFDYNILEEYVKNISIDTINQNSLGLSGTAIGDAILSAVNRFKESGNRTKVLVVITDGDANVGADPVLAARKASQENIKVYTVGVGKSGGAPMPTTDMFGNKTYARNRDGSLVMASFNEEALRQIADLGGGQYFRADDNNKFDAVMSEINSLQKRDIKVNVVTQYSENFIPYLAVLVCMFIFYLGIIAFKSEIN